MRRLLFIKGLLLAFVSPASAQLMMMGVTGGSDGSSSTPPTWSPTDKSAAIALSNANLTATVGSATQSGVRTTTGHSTGKFYISATCGTASTNTRIALATSSWVETGALALDTTNVAYVNADQNVYFNTAIQGAGVTGALVNGDILNIAVDLTNKLIWTRKNGTGNWNASVSANPATATGGYGFNGIGAGPYFVAFGSGSSGDSCTLDLSGTNGPSGFANAW